MTGLETGWHAYAGRLADRLAVDGALTDPTWRRAFEQVPRHLFVPPGPGAVAQDWLATVYADQALLTQTAATPDTGCGVQELPTSSSSQPAIMAVMLELADIHDGQTVLEIGTGTGYHAALLCHRLGQHQVSTVDIHAGLVDTARDRLAALGYQPALACGDGVDGWADRAPFDRIIATCAIEHIPPAWIRQLADTGRIVAPLAGNVGPLMVLDKTGPEELTGRFDPHPALFMPLRQQAESPLGAGETTGFTDTGMAHYGVTHLDPHLVHQAPRDLKLWLQLHVPGLRFAGGPGHGDAGSLVVHTADAMAEVTFTPGEDDRWPVVQRGRRRLWDSIEHAERSWHHHGEPGHTRLGLTVPEDPDSQYAWLDDPLGTTSWPLRQK